MKHPLLGKLSLSSKLRLKRVVFAPVVWAVPRASSQRGRFFAPTERAGRPGARRGAGRRGYRGRRARAVRRGGRDETGEPPGQDARVVVEEEEVAPAGQLRPLIAGDTV